MRIWVLVLYLLLAIPALAVQPDEILSDPALEARARDISTGLRCPVCQGETIDDSNAPISRDLRIFLRERLVAGDSDADAISAITQRFGEYVLYAPPARGINLILYLAGPVMALLALLIGWRFISDRGRDTPQTKALTEEERQRLDRIMRD